MWNDFILILYADESNDIFRAREQVGYYFAPSGKPYPDNWIITDVIYEFEGSLYSRWQSTHLNCIMWWIILERIHMVTFPILFYFKK